MRLPKAALPLLLGGLLPAAYQYYYSDSLTGVDPSKWIQNGSVTPTSGGLTAPTTNGSSLISTIAVPDGSSEYEVKTTINMAVSGGVFITYLRASSDALSGPAPSGTFYSVELHAAAGGICPLTVNKR
ncbi:MAG: hypothetical protein FJW34_26740, partial [Acidobacteria bacterium]|nr:hypothetical protein [Acidobacteriota bacterium]